MRADWDGEGKTYAINDFDMAWPAGPGYQQTPQQVLDGPGGTPSHGGMMQGGGRTDGVDLAGVTTTGDAHANVNVLELVQTEDEELG